MSVASVSWTQSNYQCFQLSGCVGSPFIISQLRLATPQLHLVLHRSTTFQWRCCEQITGIRISTQETIFIDSPGASEASSHDDSDAASHENKSARLERFWASQRVRDPGGCRTIWHRGVRGRIVGCCARSSSRIRAAVPEIRVGGRPTGSLG